MTAANDDQGPGLGQQLLLCQTHQEPLDVRQEVCNYCAIIHCYRHIMLSDGAETGTLDPQSPVTVCHSLHVRGADLLVSDDAPVF